MIRLGFVSNSSSSSFVIPKKYLDKNDYETYEQMIFDSPRCDDELHESDHYIYGKVSNHNGILTRMFKKYENMEGVDYYES